MDKSITVLIVGLWGVFLGMSILFITIKIITFITGKIEKKKESE